MSASNTTPFYNVPSPDEQLADSMRHNGIPAPVSFIWDSQFHRFPTKDGNDDAGWYVLYEGVIPCGAYGDWRTSSFYSFRANIGRELSEIEKTMNQLRMEEAKKKAEAERIERNKDAAFNCTNIWERSPEASEEHPYLVAKGIKPHIARVHNDGRLIIPMYSIDGSISSLQYISSNAEKLFHTGGVAKGRFCTIGEIGSRVFIVEGYATGATVYEETGIATVVAFSANNLEPVAGRIRAKYQDCDIIIVADNDKGGIGENEANHAAAKHGARVILSPKSGTDGTDINDYRQSGGDVASILMPETDTIKKMKVVFGNELADDYSPPDEIIQDLIVSESITVIYGDSNSGKTFFALSLAHAVSDGIDCYGKKTDKGIVIYLATEAPTSIKSRMQAMKRFHGSSLSNLAMVPVPLNFYSNAGDAISVISLVKEIEQIKGHRVKMIIGDTLARMSSGANENSGEDMGPVMERFSMVAAHTGAAVVVIHHNGKDQARGARGWSGIRAHIDTEIEVEDKDGIKSARVTKQRELSSKGQEIIFKLEIIQMGISKFGEEVSTCVAIPNDGSKRYSKTTLKRIEMLKEICTKYGTEVNGWSLFTRESARKYLIEDAGFSEENAKKNLQENGKQRFLGALLDENIIARKDDGYMVMIVFSDV
jgi:phage/plasmid primase-like uncharacterized protein